MRHALPVSGRSILAALLLAVTIAGPAEAHVPTAGASRGSLVANQVIPYRWGSSAYPTWVTAAAKAGLDEYRSENNSLGPWPSYAETGASIVYYSASSAAPCTSLVILQWLQCASNGGTTSFRIHIRDFDRAPYSDWRWWDKSGSCTTSTGRIASGCWLVARAMIHEAGHAIPTFDHDPQTEAETIMRSVSPEVDHAGGRRRTYQRCDEAALQLMWGLANVRDRFADCLDHVTGAGSRGLRTRLTVGASAYKACAGTWVTPSGRLSTTADSSYRKLADVPLAGRRIVFDRKRRSETTWTLGVDETLAGVPATGTNWARITGSPSGGAGTWDYRIRFVGDQGLDPAPAVQFAITWSSC